MERELLKPVSTRLDPETIDRIDAFCMERRYWKRNTVINNILWAVMHDFSEQEIYDMVRRNHFRSEPVEHKYEIVRAKQEM